MSNWIQTFCNQKFYTLDPYYKSILIEDIAHSLSLLCRFNGHTSRFYSVAAHSIYVAENLSDNLKLVGLLHDASEAYLSDIPSPIKPYLNYYLKYEKKLEERIYEKFGVLDLYLNNKAFIKISDIRMLATERRDLMKAGMQWDSLKNIEPYSFKIKTHSIRKTEKNFLKMFYKLLKDN